MKSPKPHTQLLTSLKKLVENVEWKNGDDFCWSPETRTVTYTLAGLAKNEGVWSLLHEAGHARAGHKTYISDIDLLMLEVDAWEHAKILAGQLGISIDIDHIEDCLDTYRDWVHQRSTCPSCGVVSFQESAGNYSCYNCQAHWIVSPSRFCRPYRRMNGQTIQKNRSRSKSETAFK